VDPKSGWKTKLYIAGIKMKEIKMLMIKRAVHETKNWMSKKKKKIVKERIRDVERD